MDNQKECSVVSRFEADKTILHLNFVNRRMLITVISVIIGFIIYASIFVVGYTIREQHWQETTFRIVEQFTSATGVSDGQKAD